MLDLLSLGLRFDSSFRLGHWGWSWSAVSVILRLFALSASYHLWSTCWYRYDIEFIHSHRFTGQSWRTMRLMSLCWLSGFVSNSLISWTINHLVIKCSLTINIKSLGFQTAAVDESVLPSLLLNGTQWCHVLAWWMNGFHLQKSKYLSSLLQLLFFCFCQFGQIDCCLKMLFAWLCLFLKYTEHESVTKVGQQVKKLNCNCSML